MSRISDPVDVRCCICNAKNKIRYVCSSSIFSGPDLDTRPAFMARYNIRYEVYSCKNCGYCNIELDQEISGADRVIQSSEYKKILKSRKSPKKANEFSCLAMLYDSKGNLVQSGFQYLKAAWICDDKHKWMKGAQQIKADEENITPIITPRMSAIAKSAAAFRIQALEKFKAAEKKNKAVMKTKGETRLLKIDLLRRMGQFDEAENICRLALKKRLGSRIRHILQYELYLCKNRDDACRDIETAMEYKIKK